MALSCELLTCAMPKMLVVCITSTEKLGSQLAIREPNRREHIRSVGYLFNTHPTPHTMGGE